MNIIQLNSYITLNGGSESVMSNLSVLLHAEGHSVINIGYNTVKEAKAVMPYAFSLGKEKYSLPTFFFEPKTVDLLVNKINETNTELVICHNVYHKYPMASLLKAIKKRTKAKLALVFHDYKAVCPRANLYNGKRICTDCSDGKFYNIIKHRCRFNSILQSSVLAADSYYNNSFRDVYSYPDVFISPSYFLADQLHKMGFKSAIHVIHNPIDIAGASSQSKDTTTGFRRTVLYAGRFPRDKGIELFLKTAEQLKDIKFLIAGAGDLIDLVKKADAELPNLEYLGMLNKEQLFNVFDRSDYLILPSIWYENNPMIIIEAMMYGLPVIGSNLGGIPELLQNGRGFIFDPYQTGSLSQTIESAMDIPAEEYHQVSAKAKDFVQGLSFKEYYKNLCALVPELKN